MKPNNIYSAIPAILEKEVFERLAGNANITIERIFSRGQQSPPTGWYDQEKNEWVIVLKGKAVLAFENQEPVYLNEGDYINIPPHKKHKVKWTDPDSETIWLAVHY